MPAVDMVMPGAVRWGLLGTSNIAERRMLPALRAHERSEAVAVGSREVGRAARFAQKHDIAKAGAYFDVLLDPDIDAVYIPLPNALHAYWIERAVLAGKHVLAEKPLTTNLEESTRLFHLAEESGVILMECMTFPRHAQHRAAEEIFESGALGTRRSVTATFEVPDRDRDDIRYDAELGGGALLDVGVYALAVIESYLGPHATLVDYSSVWRDGIDINATLNFLGPGGIRGTAEFGIGRPYRNAYELVGTTGRVHVDRAFSAPPDALPTVTLTRLDGSIRVLDLPADDQFVNTLTAFVEAIDGIGADEWRRARDSSLSVARLVDEVAVLMNHDREAHFDGAN